MPTSQAKSQRLSRVAAVREQRRQLPEPPADAARPCQRHDEGRGRTAGPQAVSIQSATDPRDAVRTSPRYPGGVPLRFARVLRYREDKIAAEADELAAVLALRT